MDRNEEPFTSPSFPAGISNNRSEAEVRATRALYAPEQPQQSTQAYRLVDAKTGEEITLPARLRCWDGAEVVVRDFKPSRFAGNQGYIYTTMNETFVPSVVGAKIVAVQP